MIQKIIAIIALVLLVSCGEEEKKLPTDFVDTISFIATCDADSSSFTFNDGESGIEWIKINSYNFLTQNFSLYPTSDNDTNLLSFDTKFKLFTTNTKSYISLKFDNIISKRTEFYKIAFPLHQMTNDDVKLYRDSIIYNSFRTNNRYSFFVNGNYRKNGIFYSFNLQFATDSTIGATFEPGSKFIFNSLNTINLQLRADKLFKKDGKVIEPTPNNIQILESNFLNCFTATINKRN